MTIQSHSLQRRSQQQQHQHQQQQQHQMRVNETSPYHTSRASAVTGDYRVIFPNRGQDYRHYQYPPPTTQAPPPVSSHFESHRGHPSEHLIPPQSDFALALLMGNATSSQIGTVESSTMTQPTTSHHSFHPNRAQPQPRATQQYHQQEQQQQQQRPRSNLAALLEPNTNTRLPPTPTRRSNAEQSCTCEYQATTTPSSSSSKHDEADSASGPPPTPPAPPPTQLGHSAPAIITSLAATRRRFSGPQTTTMGTPPTALQQRQCLLHQSAGPILRPSIAQPPVEEAGLGRRCLSSKELGTLAPPSGSPYVEMLSQREQLENEMTEKLREKRDHLALETTPSTSPIQNTGAPIHSCKPNVNCGNDVSTSSSSQQSSSMRSNSTKKTGANENRNRRRAAHHRAIVEELCSIVADLFLAESRLINPTKYGVSRSLERGQVLKSVNNFVSALPTRYALGVHTPSEVLLHMRLMAVARSDPTKCVVHIINLDNDSYWTDNGVQHKGQKNVRLVTIACADGVGLLEYITKLLGTGGSRVLDADVMLSSDRIVLDRFVVEMNGRLRLDKLAHLIEAFLKKAGDKEKQCRTHNEDCSCEDSSKGSNSLSASGPLYFNPKHQSSNKMERPDISEEIQAAVPLTEVLASPLPNDFVQERQFETLKRHFSMPNELACRSLRGQKPHRSLTNIFTPNLSSSSSHRSQSVDPPSPYPVQIQPRPDNEGDTVTGVPDTSGLVTNTQGSMRQKRPLVNRQGAPDLDRIGMEGDSVDYVTVPSQDQDRGVQVPRVIPLIPFDELMLIETIGMGRVSTIYRGAWSSPMGVQMVALKVAMVNPETGDMSHVDELRREGDIAARLEHRSVCRLVGVAADAECFCLAYDFCEGGSVLSLLSDNSRYYEYLPIALDVANGMAYLHSRDVIHRDLKPSNILLTRDHRAKLADFGMSVANVGQELTAETGTYRYMAPEVIRHESYSSNADVYSYGIFLWQLITRQVPFASMTPVQAAYAVAEGRRPPIPDSTPRRLREIIEACWDQDSHKRPSFTYIAMALADYAKLSFSPASVGAHTLQIANDIVGSVAGNSNINVDFTAPVTDVQYLNTGSHVGLEI